MTRSISRTHDLGQRLINLAPQVTIALANLARERSICDGYSTQGDGAGRGCASSSTTEAAALMAEHIALQADDIRHTVTAIETAINTLARLVNHGIGLRAPVVIPRCNDNQTGRQGGLDWGDYTCEDLPDKAGLCSRCYQRERRWRLAHGLMPRDIEPAR